MSQNIAPWLQGLDTAWEIPPEAQVLRKVSSASHDASSLRNTASRIPRRNLSGLHSSLSSQKGSVNTSTQKKRSPLATLSNNDNNTVRGLKGTTRPPSARSSFRASDASTTAYHTIQQRAKSASPTKQETLEWKRRLVHGQVNYGDQTDLFGPSGLDNIFAQARSQENDDHVSKSSLPWLDKSDVASMPSSPPPWPTKTNGNRRDETVTPPDPHASSDHPSIEEHTSVFGGAVELSGIEGGSIDLGHSQQDQLLSASGQPSGTSDLSSEPNSAAECSPRDGVGNRTISGQTELDQEDFSPVFISKHKTANGSIDYKALDSRLAKELQQMHISVQSSEPDDSSRQNYHQKGSHVQNSINGEPVAATNGNGNESLDGVPDLSLSENLPTGTPPAVVLNPNIEVVRGGYSRFGSFKQRMLSSSESLRSNSERLHTGGLSELRVNDNQQWHRDSPLASLNGHEHNGLLPEAISKSPRSPLKLFGPHDTYTNNRLVRRMSQLKPGLKDTDVYEEQSSLNISHQNNLADHCERDVSLNSFGSGELNGHDFHPQSSSRNPPETVNSNSDSSPASDVLPPGSRVPLDFRREARTSTLFKHQLERKLSTRSRSPPIAPPMGMLEYIESSVIHVSAEGTEQLQESFSDDERTAIVGTGKRLSTSRIKGSTPKRRRTLPISEFVPGIQEMDDSHHNSQLEASGSRKRKDARKGEDHSKADPEVLAKRKILRPRNPTPSQRRKERIEAEIRETTEEFAAQEPEKLEAVIEQIESSIVPESPRSIGKQAHAVANEVAKFSLRIQNASGQHDERKRSVTTQDFFNEAVLVMKLIREKAGRQSALGSVSEFDHSAASQSGPQDGVEREDDHSSLRVSRPPSREGVSGWRSRASVHTDARVISHLRKFEERDDTEFIAQTESSLRDDQDDHQQVVVMDNHSNIRITGPLPAQKREHDKHGDSTTSQRSEHSTLDTKTSNGTSTGRTVHTSSTRKSENVGTLAPDAVAHLIGDQVGSMTFDKAKQQWVKVKPTAPKPVHASFLELPSETTSDDDPFREISDLPVDETKEEKLRRTSCNRKSSSLGTIPPVANQGVSTSRPSHAAEVRTSSEETVIARPMTGESYKSPHTQLSSEPSRFTGSRYTAPGSSLQQQIETRATSWSNGELEKLSAYGQASGFPLVYDVAEMYSATVGQEDSTAWKSNAVALSTGTSLSQSEMISEGPAVEIDEEHIDLREDTAIDEPEEDVEDIESPKLRTTTTKTSMDEIRTRHMSLRRKTLRSNFMVDALEQSEVSFVAALPGERTMNVSLSVSRPLTSRYTPGYIAQPASSPSRADSSFMLSELPDFTIHENDEERPTERVLAQRLALYAKTEANDRYALAVKDLVHVLTDVEHDEPYWEDLKQLNLHNRSLVTLHGLSDFCVKVQTVDISNNALEHLKGAPSSLRFLNAISNRLSSLTSWNHLTNLQYLNISGNRLDSLVGLTCLIHLRELVVDDNEIGDFDGVSMLDGLLKISARRNKLQQLCFDNSQLYRLEELDIGGNAIHSIRNLEDLVSLKTLNLDGNPLVESLQVHQEMPHLSQISARGCSLTHLDAGKFPALRSLLIDKNRLSRVKGIENVQNIEIISMTRAKLPNSEPISIFSQPFEACSLRLSGNSIPHLDLPHTFFSLRTLDLASVGLQALPDDFGLQMPHLKSLNLNFNAIKDIRPLVNVQGLESLSVCGNRLSRLRKSVATFAKMHSLRDLDMRDNPLTQGFYPPVLGNHQTSREERNQGSVVRRYQVEPEFLHKHGEDDNIWNSSMAQYQLPGADAEEDTRHYFLLDEDTKLRRRVYHLLLANNCSNLGHLDSLSFDKTKITMKDGVWHRLIELGVVRKSTIGSPSSADNKM